MRTGVGRSSATAPGGPQWLLPDDGRARPNQGGTAVVDLDEHAHPRGTSLSTADTTTASDGVGFRSSRGPILFAVMMATSLIAIDTTILATAVPTIVADLGGFTSFPWLFSIYLLTQAVSVPIYSKLADTVGRKPVILFGVGLFLLGSILCGLATSMPALIAFRAVQGLGAGAVQPMAITIVGDLYTVAERAKVQGYLASVWAISAVLGPTLGGFFAEFLTWNWIFFINVPLCLLAGWLLIRRLHETVERRKRKIDWLGGTLLTVGVSLLILALLEGGHAWAWNSAISIGSLTTAAVLLTVFVLVERRAAEPVLPLWVLSRRLLLATALISVGVGVILIGLTSYVPTFLEALLGVSPMVSGLTLATLTIGWPIASTLSGRIYMRIGFRATVLIGASIVVLSTGALALTAQTPSVAAVGACCFAIGLGMGLVASPSLIAAQSSVGWGERGVVTGANMFSRSVGSAIGVAVLGAVVNARLNGADALDEPELFGDAVGTAFVIVVGVAIAMMVAGAWLPRGQGVPGSTPPDRTRRRSRGRSRART